MLAPMLARAPARPPPHSARAPAQRRAPLTEPAAAARTDWSFGDIDVGLSSAPTPLSGRLQRKLAIGATDDPLEHEADRVAEQVMRGFGAVRAAPTAGSGQLNRKCAACDEEGALRMKAAAPAPPAPNHAPAIVQNVLRASGQPLDPAARAFFEPRFGHDFSRVRVHAGEGAAASARAVQARAFTVGEHLVFGAGEYAPASEPGRKLLAHELAHVIQQGAGRVSRQVQRRVVVDPAAVIPMPAGASGPALPLSFAVEGMLGEICPDGKPAVNKTTGVTSLGVPKFCDWAGPPTASLADLSSTPTGCDCLCGVVNDTQTTTVGFSAGPPGTAPGPGAKGTIPGTGGVVTSPTIGIDPRVQFQNKIGGSWVDIPYFLVFAHELCGHARALMAGTQIPPAAGPAGGTPPHEVGAVDVERAIAKEHGLGRRSSDYGGGARMRP